MNSMFVICLRGLLLGAVLFTASGCYYLQAARGQLEIVRNREAIGDLVAAEDTDPELGRRLRLVAEARQFSIDELRLPDNESYRSYAQLDRDYVLWNIIAAGEFSLQAKTWCYPVVGCVSYRGYFSREAAQKKAAALRRDGYDVAFGGVAAYSTLGKLRDPVLSTMMHWNDSDLVAVIFHELAHQVLYVKNATGFNESFATAVEEFGMERWLESRGRPDELTAWREQRAVHAQFAALVAAARADLETLYAEPIDDERKRERKAARLRELALAAKALFSSSPLPAPDWLDTQLNNARLVATTLYEGRLPEFRSLLAECRNDLPCFYSAARKLADSI